MKLTEIPVKNAAAKSTDLVHIVDPTDPTSDPAGTSYAMTVENLTKDVKLKAIAYSIAL